MANHDSASGGELNIAIRIDLQRIEQDIRDIQRKFDQTQIKLKLAVDDASLRAMVQRVQQALGGAIAGGNGQAHGAAALGGGIFTGLALGSAISGGGNGSPVGSQIATVRPDLPTGGAGGMGAGFSVPGLLTTRNVPMDRQMQLTGGSNMSPGVFSAQGKTCPQCGSVTSAAASFCRKCGYDFRPTVMQNFRTFTDNVADVSGRMIAMGTGASGMGQIRGMLSGMKTAEETIWGGVQIAQGVAGGAAAMGRGIRDVSRALGWTGTPRSLDDIYDMMETGSTVNASLLGEVRDAIGGLNPTVNVRYPRSRRRRPGGPRGGGGGGGSAGWTLGGGSMLSPLASMVGVLDEDPMNPIPGVPGDLLGATRSRYMNPMAYSYGPGEESMRAMERMQQQAEFEARLFSGGAAAGPSAARNPLYPLRRQGPFGLGAQGLRGSHGSMTAEGMAFAGMFPPNGGGGGGGGGMPEGPGGWVGLPQGAVMAGAGAVAARAANWRLIGGAAGAAALGVANAGAQYNQNIGANYNGMQGAYQAQLGMADSLNALTFGLGNVVDYSTFNFRGAAMRSMAGAQYNDKFSDQMAARRIGMMQTGAQTAAISPFFNDQIAAMHGSFDARKADALEQLNKRMAAPDSPQSRAEQLRREADDLSDYKGISAGTGGATMVYTGAKTRKLKEAKEQGDLASSLRSKEYGATGSIGSVDIQRESTLHNMLMGRGYQTNDLFGSNIQQGLVNSGLAASLRGDTLGGISANAGAARAGVMNTYLAGKRGLKAGQDDALLEQLAQQRDLGLGAVGLQADEQRRDYRAGLVGMGSANRSSGFLLNNDRYRASLSDISGGLQQAEIKFGGDPQKMALYKQGADIARQQARIDEGNRRTTFGGQMAALNASTTAIGLSNENKDFQAQLAQIGGSQAQQIAGIEASNLLPEEKQRAIAGIKSNGEAQLGAVQRQIKMASRGGTAGSFGNYINYANLSNRDEQLPENLTEAMKKYQEAMGRNSSEADKSRDRVKNREQDNKGYQNANGAGDLGGKDTPYEQDFQNMIRLLQAIASTIGSALTAQ